MGSIKILALKGTHSEFISSVTIVKRTLKMAKFSEFISQEPLDRKMQEKFLGFGEQLTNTNSRSSTPEIPKDIERTNDIIVKIDFKNEADDIAKKLLENKLAISLCQNLSYYSTITSNNLEISNDGHGNCPCPLLPNR